MEKPKVLDTSIEVIRQGKQKEMRRQRPMSGDTEESASKYERIFQEMLKAALAKMEKME